MHERMISLFYYCTKMARCVLFVKEGYQILTVAHYCHNSTFWKQ